MPTTDENDTPETREILAIERTNYFTIGLSLTAVILLLAATYVFVEFEALYKLKPNEFVDFLAGIFGPLVLLWVVMGFLQQGAELKYSREALLLQAKELKASIDAQQNMGEAAWAGVHATVERLKTMQPVFTLIGAGSSSSEHDLSLFFSLSNLGKDALDVKFRHLGSNLSITPASFSKFTAR